MAKHLKCHTTLVSQVLKGKTHLSLEHAMSLNPFLKHDENESHHFLLLVNAERAGTQELKHYYQGLAQESRERHLNLSVRSKKDFRLSEEIAANYYQNWATLAVHVAISIPALNHFDAMAKHLRIPAAQLKKILQFLEGAGLVQQKRGQYSISGSPVYLADDSKHLVRHHTHWRLRAISSLDGHSPKKDFHYSSVISLSEKDCAVVKELFVEMVEKIRGIVKKSPEEKLYAYTLDFFGLDN